MIKRLEARCNRPLLWEFQIFFLVSREKKQNKTKQESKMSDRYPVRDPPRIYLRTKHREGGNEVVFSLRN